MQNILIIDTETTGLSPEKGAKIIEIGAILYNVKHKVALQNFSTFLPCEENPVEDINHIKPEWTQWVRILNNYSLIDCVKSMARNADFIVAHNAEFDKRFLKTLNELGEEFWSKQWICTKKDFKWPVTLYRNRLMDICEAMKVSYVEAHRALADCNFIASCFSKIEDLESRLLNAIPGTFGEIKGNAYCK